MTPREYLLARVLAERDYRGPALVLKGPKRETWQRQYHAESVIGTLEIAEGDNTWEEAMFAASHYTGNLTVVTSAYHQLRAFLTFVKAAEGSLLAIYNCPAPSGMEDLEREFAKIDEYQRRGHVATYEAGLAHLAWRDAA